MPDGCNTDSSGVGKELSLTWQAGTQHTVSLPVRKWKVGEKVPQPELPCYIGEASVVRERALFCRRIALWAGSLCKLSWVCTVLCVPGLSNVQIGRGNSETVCTELLQYQLGYTLCILGRGMFEHGSV